MLLTIDGAPRQLIPIKDFRAAHDLPPEFGVSLFEPKDWTGLGRIDRAGAELNSVRAALLAAIPPRMTAYEWLLFSPTLAHLFEAQLYEINPSVGLKDVEIEFAVAGFSDVCQGLWYALASGSGANPLFHHVYSEWLNNSIRIFSTLYPYTHQNQTWEVQIFAHAYGRAGLIIRTPTETHYTYDPALGCPAEGFMTSLMREITERVEVAVGGKGD
jgi:hypothetical protein